MSRRTTTLRTEHDDMDDRRISPTHKRIGDWTLRAALAVAVCATLAACTDGRGQFPGAARLSPLGSPPLDPSALPQPANDEPPDIDPRYRGLADQVAQRHAEILDRLPPRAVLDEIELVFFASNRAAELAGYYRRAVDTAGTGSALRPRLAWLLQRLGQPTVALQEARRAVAERPDDAIAHFAHGFVLGQLRSSDPEAIRAIREAFTRAIELDPALQAPGGVTVADLRREIETLDAVIARSRTAEGSGANAPASSPPTTAPAPHDHDGSDHDHDH